MNFVYVGKIVNTHGLKGEVRILSNFSLKEKIFKPGFIFYVNEKPLEIVTYRKHKNYDMVTFKGLTDIDQVLPLKGKDVYFNRSDIESTVILDTDLIGMEIVSDLGKRGKVIDIQEGVRYSYLEVLKNQKTYFIPNVDAFIQHVDLENKTITIHEIEGLIDEN